MATVNSDFFIFYFFIFFWRSFTFKPSPFPSSSEFQSHDGACCQWMFLMLPLNWVTCSRFSLGAAQRAAGREVPGWGVLALSTLQSLFVPSCVFFKKKKEKEKEREREKNSCFQFSQQVASFWFVKCWRRFRGALKPVELLTWARALDFTASVLLPSPPIASQREVRGCSELLCGYLWFITGEKPQKWLWKILLLVISFSIHFWFWGRRFKGALVKQGINYLYLKAPC